MRISDWSSDVCSSDLAVPLVRRLMKEAGVVPTGGATGANRFNLSGPWLAAMQRISGGTPLGRQAICRASFMASLFQFFLFSFVPLSFKITLFFFFFHFFPLFFFSILFFFFLFF